MLACWMRSPGGRSGSRWSTGVGSLDGKARLLRLPHPPATTQEMRLRTWATLVTRADGGVSSAEQWRAHLDELHTERRGRTEAKPGTK
jgi:hypothetical protein